MVMLQVDEVNAVFAEVEELRKCNWKQVSYEFLSGIAGRLCYNLLLICTYYFLHSRKKEYSLGKLSM